MNKRHHLRGAACAFAIALVIAACGSSDEADHATAQDSTDESSSSDAGNDASTDSNLACGLANGELASGEPIAVGAIVGQTGPDDFSSSADAAAAYFDCVNANGGINGRPIEYLVEDDQWTPEVAGQVAVRLVEDQNVVAMIGGASFVECGVNADLYESAGVISMPGVGVPRQCFESPNIAPINEGPRLSTLGAAQYAASELGAKSFVCVALNIPGLGDWVCDGVEEWATANGYTSITQLIDPALPDPNAVALDALSEKTDVILNTLPAGAATPVLAAAEQQDGASEIDWLGPTSLFDADFPGAIGDYWNERLHVQIELALLDSVGSDNQLWLAVMDEFGDDDDPRDSFSQAGFVSAKLFTDALLSVEDPATIDRAVASDAIAGIVAETDLLCGSWYFGSGDQHNANHSGQIVVTNNGGYDLLAGCTAVEDAALTPILELETELGIG